MRVFAVRLHEFGHGIAGVCPEQEPHRRDPNETNWWQCIACETSAWREAMKLAPFTRAMHDVLRRCLRSYRQTITGPASAVAALDNLSSNLTYALDKQARLKREMRLEKHAALGRQVRADEDRAARERWNRWYGEK